MIAQGSKSVALFLVLLLTQFSLGEDRSSPAQPVAVVSALTGEGHAVRRADSETREPLRWLTLAYPGDTISTSPDGKTVLTFFSDRSKWTLASDAEAKVTFEGLKTDGLFAQKVAKQGGAERGFQIPQVLVRRPEPGDLDSERSSDLSKEKVHLAAYVDVGLYPPVFRWAPNSLSDYRVTLFDSTGQFLHSFQVDEEELDYPRGAEAPFRLVKGAKYYWQVTDVDGNQLVNRYPFYPLTRVQIKELHRYERALAEDKPSTYVDLLLVQMQHDALDKYVHLLERMRDMDPENPRLKEVLHNAYLQRGVPAHAGRLVTR